MVIPIEFTKEYVEENSPKETYPTAKMLAMLEDNGPRAKVFWDEKEYPMFNENNEILR